jgi:hypothetical protein
MKFFYIFHYRCDRDLWTHTLVRASDTKAARKVFRKISDDHIISIQASRY